MKKFIISMLAIILIVSLAVQAQAITTGQWDFEAGSQHAQDTAQNMLEQEATEPTEELPEDSADDGWRSWLSRWLEWWLRQKQ